MRFTLFKKIIQNCSKLFFQKKISGGGGVVGGGVVGGGGAFIRDLRVDKIRVDG